MTVKGTAILIMRRLGFKFLTLRNHFNFSGVLKQGLHTFVHVVDKDGLIQLAAGNAFNENLFLKKHTDKKFPEFLQIEPFASTYFIMCDEEGRLVASATLRPEQNRMTEMMISQISIHPDFRNKGYATRLLLEVAKYLNIVRPDVTRMSISRFMPMGHKYLRRKFIEIAPEFKAQTFEIYQETFWDKCKRKG
jgi:predicted GNAT family N-acyltransferase